MLPYSPHSRNTGSDTHHTRLYRIYYRAKGKIGERHRERGEPSIYADRGEMKDSNAIRIGHNYISTHGRRTATPKPPSGGRVSYLTYKATVATGAETTRQRAYCRPGRRKSTHTPLGIIQASITNARSERAARSSRGRSFQDYRVNRRTGRGCVVGGRWTDSILYGTTWAREPRDRREEGVVFGSRRYTPTGSVSTTYKQTNRIVLYRTELGTAYPPPQFCSREVGIRWEYSTSS